MNSSLFNTRLSAFTLTEVLVAMILAGIAITATWSALHLVTKRIVLAEASYDATENISRMSAALYTDFQNSDSIKLVDNSISMYKRDGEVNYTLQVNRVIRLHNAQRDTFSASAAEAKWNAQAGILRINFKVNGEADSLILHKTRTATERSNDD